MLSEADLNVICYTLLLLTGLPVSYKYAVFMVSHTGMVIPHFFVSFMINLCFGVLCIIGWIFFSVKINTYFLFGGVVLGGGLTLISLIVLFVLLFLKRKKMLQAFLKLNT